MIWSPAGPTVIVGATATRFVPINSLNAGGVVRLINTTLDTVLTVSIGNDTVANIQAIPLSPGQDIIIGYGAGDTHAIASATPGIAATPGIGRP